MLNGETIKTFDSGLGHTVVVLNTESEEIIYNVDEPIPSKFEFKIKVSYSIILGSEVREDNVHFTSTWGLLIQTSDYGGRKFNLSSFKRRKLTTDATYSVKFQRLEIIGEICDEKWLKFRGRRLGGTASLFK